MMSCKKHNFPRIEASYTFLNKKSKIVDRPTSECRKPLVCPSFGLKRFSETTNGGATNTHSHDPLTFDVCCRYKSKTPVVPLII